MESIFVILELIIWTYLHISYFVITITNRLHSHFDLIYIYIFYISSNRDIFKCCLVLTRELEHLRFFHSVTINWTVTLLAFSGLCLSDVTSLYPKPSFIMSCVFLFNFICRPFNQHCHCQLGNKFHAWDHIEWKAWIFSFSFLL